MEYWDVYDKDKIKTKKTMSQNSAFEVDTYHLVVHVCIFNSKGEMLIQKRHPLKEGWGNIWDVTVAGSVLANESSQEGARREVLEEIGYLINLKDLRPSFTINFDQGFDDFYLIKQDLDINTLVLQRQEVQEVKWASIEEILSLIETGEFIPYHKSFLSLLFDISNNAGIYFTLYNASSIIDPLK